MSSPERPKRTFRRVLLLVAVSFLILIGIVFAIGYTLPATYTADGTIELAATPDEIWAQLADFEAHPRGGAQVQGVERLADVDGKPQWREDLGGTTLLVTATRWDAPAGAAAGHMVNEAEDEKVPMKAYMEFVLTPVEGGTELHAIGRTTLDPGTWHVPLFRVAMSLFGGAEAHLDGFLRDLGVGYEAGSMSWKDE